MHDEKILRDNKLGYFMLAFFASFRPVEILVDAAKAASRDPLDLDTSR